ncbi:MAG: FAD-dependent pyridine nucleotide-disulfide oxidoreductase [Devosia sp.]|nr:FAD-dependent pyridine nucleotide-disulfide oxidoreductase [Devosia sp.]
MADPIKPDLCIIGAGALGVELARRARRQGASVVLVDRGRPEAGDGAADTVALAALSDIARRARDWRTGGAVGLSGDAPKINHRAVSEQVARVAAALAPERSPERLEALGITRLLGAPAFADKQTLTVGTAVVRAGNFVLATGAPATIPPVPGLAAVPFFTLDTILLNTRKLTHLVVIGGNAPALELAQIYLRLGSQVTIASPTPILPEADSETRAILLRALREEGASIHENVEIAILPRSQGIGVQLRHGGGEISPLDASHLLVSVGRNPDLARLELDKAGVAVQPAAPDRLQLNAVGRTTNRRVFAVGAASGQFHPHAARRQGQVLLDRLLGRRAGRSSSVTPWLVMTEPELAQIGDLDPLPGRTRANQQILRANWSENPRARAVGAAHGAAKLVVNAADGTLAGAALVGTGAAEMMAILALAMERRLPVTVLAELVLPHPSFAEVLRAAAEQFEVGKSAVPPARRRIRLPRLFG